MGRGPERNFDNSLKYINGRLFIYVRHRIQYTEIVLELLLQKDEYGHKGQLQKIA